MNKERVVLMVVLLLIVMVSCGRHGKSSQEDSEITPDEIVDSLQDGDWLTYSFAFFSLKYPSDWTYDEAHYGMSGELGFNGIGFTLRDTNSVVSGECVDIRGEILLDTLRTPEYWRDFFMYAKQFDSEYVSVVDDGVVNTLSFGSYPAAMAEYIMVTENGDTLTNKQLTVLVDKKVLYYINNQYAWQDKGKEHLGDSILSTMTFNDSLLEDEWFNCSWKTYDEYNWDRQPRWRTSSHVEDPTYHYGKIVRGASTRITDRPITVPTGKIMGHGYVDLGLSVKWATCNVGASAPWKWGYFFKWGDTATYDQPFRTDTCEAHKKKTGDISGNPHYDVARAKWGGTWRVPTKEECRELIDKCKWAFTPLNYYGGYGFGCMVTGPNGNRIYFPAAGNLYGCHDNMDERGYYWTSTPVEDNAKDTRVGVWSFCFGNDYGGSVVDLYLSCDHFGIDGFSIRPVSK